MVTVNVESRWWQEMRLMSDDELMGLVRIDDQMALVGRLFASVCVSPIVCISKANWSARDAVGELVRPAHSFFLPCVSPNLQGIGGESLGCV